MIDVLETLADPGLEAHTSIVLAYNVDLLLYDKLVRRRLASAGATSQIVFCDATAYAAALDAVDPTSRIGLAYSVTPVRVSGAFHPKAYLLLGARRGRLVLGSGNASLGGLVRNAEVFGTFDFDAEKAAAPHAAFSAIFELCRELAGAAPPTVRAQLERAEKRTPWLQLAPSPDPRLVHIGGPKRPPLIDALRLGGAKPRRVIALSSSFDRQLAAVAALARLGDGTHETVVVVQSEQAKIDGPQLNRLPPTVRWTEFVDPRPTKTGEPRDSFAHAKLYIVETDGAEHLFFGSANLSRPALLEPTNVEILVQLPPAAPGTWAARLGLEPSLSVDARERLLARQWTGDGEWKHRPIHLAGVEWSTHGWIVATDRRELPDGCMLALGARHDLADITLALGVDGNHLLASADRPLTTARFAWLVDHTGDDLSARVAITWPDVARPSIGKWLGARATPALIAMKNGELLGPILLEFLDQAPEFDLLAVSALGRAGPRDRPDPPADRPAPERSPESFYTGATHTDVAARAALGDRTDIELLAWLIQPITSDAALRIDHDDEEEVDDELPPDERPRRPGDADPPPDPQSARRWKTAGRRLARRLDRAATALAGLLRVLPDGVPLPPHLLARQIWMSRIAAFVADHEKETEADGRVIAVEPEVLAHYVLRCAAPLAGDASRGLLRAVDASAWSAVDGRTLAGSLPFFVAVCTWAVAWFESRRPGGPVRTVHEAIPLFVLARLLVVTHSHLTAPDFLDVARTVPAWKRVEAHAIDDTYRRATRLAAWLRDLEDGRVQTNSTGVPTAGSLVLLRKYGASVVLSTRSDTLSVAMLGRERPYAQFKTSEVRPLQPPPAGRLLLADVQLK